jgi:hypothetical protein
MKRWLSVAFFAGWRVVCLLLGLCQPDAVASVNGYDHTASWSRSLVCFVEPAQASHTAVCKALDFPLTRSCASYSGPCTKQGSRRTARIPHCPDGLPTEGDRSPLLFDTEGRRAA